MSNLHAYFSLRNQQGFARAIDGSRGQASSQTSGPTLSSSGGKSWTRASALSSTQSIDVNARDWLGRTVLHLACATTESFALAYVRLLLAHPHINVNIQDTESRWSALHRALYSGNIAAAQLLLQRPDTDVQLRDYEGLSPFDLYNTTVDGTRPMANLAQSSWDRSIKLDVDLFTWGGNRNAVLGHGDGDDRTYPDQVVIKRPEVVDAPLSTNFTSIHVQSISMAKLHTTIITDEPRGNLRACGFGSGGRLGPGQHTQYSLLPVPQFTHHVVAVALGQDHTLVVTSEGEVLSWGLNRFSQLGYMVDPLTSGSLHTRAKEEPIQAIARKVVGPLKKEIVVGVAACKTASACWTRTDVFTWGTNNGQLGYDRAAQPVQILPRKVTGVQAVTDLAMTDSAMACLLDTQDVICFRDDSHFRVKFPIPELSEFPPYLHPFVNKTPVVKVTSCDGVFGALSTRGDVFTFSVPEATLDSGTGRVERGVVKPQRVWSLRKWFDPVKDIALGSDGEIILCTESGHVFVRSRHMKGGAGGKTLKFHRVPFIHRAVRVCANSTGSFAALRLNYTPKRVEVAGPSIVDDLRHMRPWLNFDVGLHTKTMFVPEDHEEAEALEVDVMDTLRLCALLTAEKDSQKKEGCGLFREPKCLSNGADIFVQVGFNIPAHRVILAMRSSSLQDLIQGSVSILRDASVTIKYHGKGTGVPRLLVTGCHTMTILLVLEYLYSDDVPAIWDRRVAIPCSDHLARLKVNVMQVKTELEVMARVLKLPALSTALSATGKRVPEITLSKDMEHLFGNVAISSATAAVRPNVYLELADERVASHSVVLRARSVFFRSFFDDEDWTINRWAPDGTLTMDMRHFEWRAMKFVMAWLYYGDEQNLFDHLDSVNSVQELLDLVFTVMAIASELLLDRLILICSSIILRHITLNNVASVLADATYYNALPLVDSLQAYVSSNLEAIMESRLLDDLQPDLIRSLSCFIQNQQANNSPVMRSNLIVDTALRKAKDWMDLQDIPQPLIRSHRPVRESPKLYPVASDKAIVPRRASGPVESPLHSPALGATAKPSPPRTPKPSHADDIFSMEDIPADSIPVLNIGQPLAPSTGYALPASPWKARSTPSSSKADLKAIMAEAASTRAFTVPDFGGPFSSRPADHDVPERGGSGSFKWSQKPSQRERRKIETPPSGMPFEPLSRISGPGPPWKPSVPQPSTTATAVSFSIQVTKPSKPQPETPASILQAPNRSPGSVSTRAPAPRRTHVDTPAWTNPPVQDSLPSAGLSFAVIQQQQRDQRQDSKGKRSLREIQEEEKAKQEEEDFLKWWVAEEQRLKAEAEAADQVSTPGAVPSYKRERGSRRGRQGGRGARSTRGEGRSRTGN